MMCVFLWEIEIDLIILIIFLCFEFESIFKAGFPLRDNRAIETTALFIAVVITSNRKQV